MAKFLVVHTDPSGHLIGDGLYKDITRAGAELVFFRGAAEEFDTVARDADAILNADFKLPAERIAALGRCRLISRFGTGVDNIDVEAARARGIPVSNVPNFCSEEVANRALTLLLACACQLPRLDRAVREGRWRDFEAAEMFQIEGQTLGLVGFGQIARSVARRARAFGMKVQAYDPFVSATAMRSQGAKPASMDALLRTSDFVSLHVPLTRQTHHLIDQKKLSLMKPSAVLINTARGGVVDESALVAHLQKGLIARAGLDVYEKEPPLPDNPLLASDRVVLTPHSSAIVPAALDRVRIAAVNNVVRVLKGLRPLNVVNPVVPKSSPRAKQVKTRRRK